MIGTQEYQVLVDTLHLLHLYQLHALEHQYHRLRWFVNNPLHKYQTIEKRDFFFFADILKMFKNLLLEDFSRVAHQ